MTTDSTTNDTTAANPASSPVYIESADHLSQVVDEHDVVLVDFFATWCGPCQMLEPVLETLAEETDAVIAKVDVDQLQQLAAHYGVRGVPTILLFADGQQVEQHVGVLPEAQMRQLIDNYTN